ncbi:MAG TPA: hypothetical protein VJ251_02125, partial [Stellaceae bacterium]|nr:hypothetical protein [Stellaceae bacterium]
PPVAACHVQVNRLDQPMIWERDISLPLDAAVLQRIAEPASSKSAESDDRKPKVPNPENSSGCLSGLAGAT